MILSTNREQFIHKCNILVKSLFEKKMILNFKKSGYLVINAWSQDFKSFIKLTTGWLPYKSTQKYLGVMFSDTGLIKHDINVFIKRKSKEINVKLASFLRKNEFAPIHVKLKVVNACINSALMYGCESWGNFPLNPVEVLQRKALKMVLGLSRSTSNEILYTESGFRPLKPSIYKRQLKFFRKIKENCANKPNSVVSMLFIDGLNKKTSFLKHYIKLDNTFPSLFDCFTYYKTMHDEQVREKIIEKHRVDKNSILGTYFSVNPNLESHIMYREVCCNENDRTILSKYRVGCHMLKIQSERLTSSVASRETRLCKCNLELQTLEHVIIQCPLTEIVREAHNLQHNNLTAFFKDNNLVKLATSLKAIEKLVL